MRGRDLAGGTGRSGRDRDAIKVEGDDQRFRPWCRARRPASYWGAARRAPPKITASGVDGAQGRPRAGRAASPYGAASAASAALAAAAAAPKAAMAATFSVPARAPALLPAAADQRVGEVQPRRAGPARRRPSAPPILCALSVSRSAPSAAMSSAMRPAACTASTCSSPPCRCTIAAASRDRLDHAGLVVGGHQRDENALLRQRLAAAAASAPRSITPSRSTGSFSTASGANRPPASTEGCSIAETSRRSNGRLSPPTCRSGDSASAFASVPPEVKTTLRASAPDERRDVLARLFDDARAPPGLRHGRRTGCRAVPAPYGRPRAPRPAAGHSHSSRGRYAPPLILDPTSPL